jgi:hypothetical protein
MAQIAQDYEHMAQARERTEVNNVSNVTPLNAGTATGKG